MAFCCLKRKKSKVDSSCPRLSDIFNTSNTWTSAEHKLYQHAIRCLQTKHAGDDDGSNIDTNRSVHKYEASTDSLEINLYEALNKPVRKVNQQTYKMWKAIMDMSFRIRRFRRRANIYLIPLDYFPGFVSTEFCITLQKRRLTSFFQFLQIFTQVFFQGLTIKLLPAVETADWLVTSRVHPTTNQKQLLVGDLQRHISTLLPADGACVLGVTWTDLYPGDNYNFVLGEANGSYNSAIFSFGRHEPSMYRNGNKPEDVTAIDGKIMYKMCKVICHETCHLMGLAHCTYFQCAMNESIHVSEALAQPPYLCAVCLQKLQKICRFDIVKRYQDLHGMLEQIQALYPYEGFVTWIEWIEHLLDFVDS